MKDTKLREFLGVCDCNGRLDCPMMSNGYRQKGLLAHLRDRIESLEEYLGVRYESSPSYKGYPKHVKVNTK